MLGSGRRPRAEQVRALGRLVGSAMTVTNLTAEGGATLDGRIALTGAAQLGSRDPLLVRRCAVPHVTFIHGISNKPRADELLRIWNGTLSDHDIDLDSQGVTTSMVCWADLLYPEPLSGTHLEAAGTELAEEEVPDIGMRWVVEAEGEDAAF